MTAGVGDLVMAIDSFGYEVMSLDELVNELQRVQAKHPDLRNKPVWVANCPPLHWPVKLVVPERPDGSYGVSLIVERGGA